MSKSVLGEVESTKMKDACFLPSAELLVFWDTSHYWCRVQKKKIGIAVNYSINKAKSLLFVSSYVESFLIPPAKGELSLSFGSIKSTTYFKEFIFV